jgi:hypothetical protein
LTPIVNEENVLLIKIYDLHAAIEKPKHIPEDFIKRP